ncbi:MAG: biotin carboxylase N-terminal domain-containing protein [Myxococcota bacterium]|nr:biotin carboxylase N-terminal domain-containing protein [Myxococcota bacterium]
MSSIRSIHRLAIVNRGEAAMRCIRAIKSLRALEHTDMEVIALYTEGDSDAPFVRHADRAIDITNPKGAVAAYLDHDALINVLRACEADAVWPGWGFVAEDPSFVERLEEEGITFLGPTPSAMKALGDKITSKELAEKAGVPVTAWSEGPLESIDSARHHADIIGYPVIIKATAGGGGRGIRVVQAPEEIEDAFTSAESEAASAFGNGTLFCEKLVTGGRHIEVQIAADEHGNVIALGCRDCSVQRRHQKVLEEAPPPWLDAHIIETLKESAAQMARFVGYRGLGTVEFLLQGEDFFFLEVNPRLQVEHGITEEITGLDLVQLQIKIARGESIEDLAVSESGVALEARVCAEDPDENFLPSPGRIARFDPALGPRVRIDSGVIEGTTVSPDFDSLIAKVIATGSNRAEAIARLDYALRDFELVVDGGASNKGYLLELLQADDYNAGPVDTTWLDRWNEDRGLNRAGSESQDQDAFVAAAILAYQQSRRAARDSFYSDTGALARERIPLSQGQQIDLTYEGESYRLLVYAIGSWGYRVHLDGRAVRATMREEGAHRGRLIIDGRVRRMVYDYSELGLWLEVDGHPYRYGLQTAGQVRSGSPGMVVAIQVAEGDRVRAGQALGLLEAMKMEIGFQAPVSGTVSEVLVRAGQQVAAGEVLLVIDAATDDAEVLPAKARVTLPPQRDPLALLFAVGEDGELQQPDLEAANEADQHERRAAMDAVREEIRRVILGFDTNPDRGAHLAAFLEAPLTDSLSETFLYEMAEIRHEVTTFVEIEQLFIRAPRASISGELGPSNDARLRMYVRRIRAAGAGIAEEFLELVSCALAHYGVSSLEPSDALERAVLRLLSAQRDPSLRYRLLLGVVNRVTALVASGLDLARDETLDASLADLARLRPQVGNALADAAIEASYMIFLRPGIEARAARTSRTVENWLASSETQLTAPPVDVLLEVAAAPRSVFDRVGQWISGDDPLRSEIALAAHTQRRYAPRIPQGFRTRVVSGCHIYGVDYPGLGLVLATRASATDLLSAVEAIFEAADEVRASEPGLRIHAIEVAVPPKEVVDFETLREGIEARLEGRLAETQFTVGLLGEEGGIDHVFKTWEQVNGELVLRPLYDLHPETARRIDLARYGNFELERIPAEEGIYPFYGHALDVPGDERVFVLGDMRDRAPTAGQDFTLHLPSFERTFQRAARSLRTIIQERDPRRRLQWNRIAIFVAPSIYFDTASIEGIAGRLAPATRNLGLEKVLVRLNLLDRNHPSSESVPHEIEILDTRDQMQIGLRSPHHALLQPAREYERKILITRRNRQPYAYEIIKMLTQQERNVLGRGDENETQALPLGRFEEYDLEPKSESNEAIPVAGRAYGENVSGIVFGVISTPTDKVPEGMRRVLVLSDASMDMGALAAPECDRLVAAFDMAERLSLPLEWVSISSGARIAMDSGTENLDATARVVRRIVTFTQAGGTVNLIVAGVNIGAQAYFDALATMLMHTRGVLIMTQDASMLLTGRRALEAAGSVSAEDEAAIGGYERIMGPNGEAQYQARNLAEAYRILYEHYRFDYIEPGEKSPRRLESGDPEERSICDFEIVDDEFGFATVGEIFDDETNPGRKRPFSMRAVMQAVIDQDGGHLERWQDMVGGGTTIVWDAHLGGVPVELIGIESHSAARDGYRPHDGPPDWSGGTLFPRSSKKMARAINAASGVRPVVILANLSGFDGSPESLRKLQLEYGAEIARAVVNFQGPILFSVVSRYHGGAYVVFSQELNSRLEATALTGSFASVIGGGPAASVVFAREVRAQAAADPRVVTKQREVRFHARPEARDELEALIEEVTLEKQAEIAAEFDQIHSVDRAREVGSLREIIDPVSLRHSLIEALRRALDES